MTLSALLENVQSIYFMNKKTFFIIAGIIITIGGIATTLFIKQVNNVPYELATVQKGNIIQEVSASGKVESPIKIDLHFKNSGKLTAVNAKVGSRVFSGQILAKQDSNQLDAQALEMQAGIDVQKAKLDQLISGASLEDIALAETQISNAQIALDDALKSMNDKIEDAYTKSDQAIHNTTDKFFSNPKTTNPQLTFIIANSQLENDLENMRPVMEATLTSWRSSLDTDSATSIKTKKDLDQLRSFLSKAADALASAIGGGNTSQATIESWKTEVATVRTNLNAAYAAITAGEDAVRNAQSALKVAQDQLALKKAPIRPSDIAVYQSQISQAEASLQKTQTQREDLVIFAPSSGVVIEVNGDVGEIVGPEKIVVSLATGGALQIKLDVVEDNIVNIRIGQEARITFDSIKGEEFYGKVVAIDPAETIIGGAVYYKTTVLFEKKDERIRSGMTANVWIKTAVSENTLFVPVSAVQNKNGKKIIQIFEGNQTIDKEITTGIKNDLGMIEITSGVSMGEQVVLGNKK